MKDEYDFSQAKRGAIEPTPAGKTRITIRLDDDIIDWFRQQAEQAGGGNYQTAINQALREHIERQSLEALLRRVVREELRNVA
jgi:uncharacterized protein (DUF4415 family)